MFVCLWIFHVLISPPKLLGQFQQNLAQSNLLWRRFKIPQTVQGEIITTVKMHKKSSSPEPLGWFKFVQMKGQTLSKGRQWKHWKESYYNFVFLFTNICLGFIEFFHSYGDVTIIGEGLQILTYARHSWPLNSEGSLASHTYCGTGHQFIIFISEDPWHAHLLPSI